MCHRQCHRQCVIVIVSLCHHHGVIITVSSSLCHRQLQWESERRECVSICQVTSASANFCSHRKSFGCTQFKLQHFLIFNRTFKVEENRNNFKKLHLYQCQLWGSRNFSPAHLNHDFTTFPREGKYYWYLKKGKSKGRYCWYLYHLFHSLARLDTFPHTAMQRQLKK